MAEAGEDPPLADLDRDLGFRLIPWLRRPGRQDHRAVVLGELLVGALHAGLVPARDHDAALELIGHDDLRDAPEEREGPLVARDPVRHLLGAGGLGVGVVRRAEDGDEQFDRDDLARGGIEEPRLLAGVVHEALLAGAVDLAHGQAAALQPAAVELAELGVPVAVGMVLEVFEVEQFEGDAGLAPLGVQVGAVRDGTVVGGRRRGPVHAGLQRLVGEALDLAPVEAGRAGAQHRGPHGAAADPQALRHVAVAEPEAPLLSQDLSGLTHG